MDRVHRECRIKWDIYHRCASSLKWRRRDHTRGSRRSGYDRTHGDTQYRRLADISNNQQSGSQLNRRDTRRAPCTRQCWSQHRDRQYQLVTVYPDGSSLTHQYTDTHRRDRRSRDHTDDRTLLFQPDCAANWRYLHGLCQHQDHQHHIKCGHRTQLQPGRVTTQLNHTVWCIQPIHAWRNDGIKDDRQHSGEGLYQLFPQ